MYSALFAEVSNHHQSFRFVFRSKFSDGFCQTTKFAKARPLQTFCCLVRAFESPIMNIQISIDRELAISLLSNRTLYVRLALCWAALSLRATSPHLGCSIDQSVSCH